jgi:hypothetical protein
VGFAIGIAIGLGVDDATAGAASLDAFAPVPDESDDGGEIPQPASVNSPPSAKTKKRAERRATGIAEFKRGNGWRIMSVDS